LPYPVCTKPILILAGIALFVCGILMGILCAGAREAHSVGLHLKYFALPLAAIIAAAVRIGYLWANRMNHSTRAQPQATRDEAESLLSEKHASIAKLAGGVAHEINNPLTGIFTYIHMLLRRPNLPDDIRSDLEIISRETERVRNIVRGLLDYSQQTRLERQPADMNLLCRSVIALMENPARNKEIRLVLEEGSGLPTLIVDQTRLQSVLLNVLLNALEATEPGGQITLSTAIGVPAQHEGTRGIEIICRDTGSGIPSEHLGKILDPFFTTKEIGQGSGLGLSVAYGIVEQHRGTIIVQSMVGRGSTVTIWLPAEEQTAANK
jgi:two-component system, NtrC family, sensor kinase